LEVNHIVLIKGKQTFYCLGPRPKLLNNLFYIGNFIFLNAKIILSDVCDRWM